MEHDQNYRDEVFAEVAAERTLEEILTTKITPDILEMLLRLKNPPSYEWVREEIAQKLAVFGQPGHEQYREVVNDHLHRKRISGDTKEAIRRRIAEAIARGQGTIASRSRRVSDYITAPPEPQPYQNRKILSRAGVTVLAGRPKMGKSYLALDLAIAIAGGGMFLSSFEMAYPGDVLYLALEDHASRMWSRAQAVAGGANLIPQNIWVEYSAPGLYGGKLVREVREWAEQKAEQPRLVVIDIYRMVQSTRGMRDDLYASEYSDIAQLTELSHSLDMQVLIITHLNKSYSAVDDIADSVMSSTAITGGASAIWVLANRGEDGVDAELHVSGKDIPRWSCALETITLGDHVKWRAIGDTAKVIRGKSQNDIILALYRWEGANPTQTELREVVCETMDKGNFSRLMKKLREDGLIEVTRNKYGLTQQGASAAEIIAQTEGDPAGPDDW